MNKETPREEFKRLVIMALHPGMSYEEARGSEGASSLCRFYSKEENEIITLGESCSFLRRKNNTITMCSSGITYKPIGLPITIGRVMQAFLNREVFQIFEILGDNLWKLTKENGQEAIDDDQTDECISALLKLLKS